MQKILEQIGFTKHEAKVYLTVLKSGEIQIVDLTKQTQLPRSTLVETVESLHKKGFMHYYLQRGRKHWYAENPEKLSAIMEERHSALNSIMPRLKNLRGGWTEKPIVKIYTGNEEIKQILDDIIETKHNIKALVSWDDWVDLFGTEFLKDFIERRIQHNLRIQLITPITQTSLKLKKLDTNELRQTRFLSSQIGLRRVTHFIYGNKNAIISLNKKSPTGIVIEDPYVLHATTIYFNNLWEQSSIKI